MRLDWNFCYPKFGFYEQFTIDVVYKHFWKVMVPLDQKGFKRKSEHLADIWRWQLCYINKMLKAKVEFHIFPQMHLLHLTLYMNAFWYSSLLDCCINVIDFMYPSLFPTKHLLAAGVSYMSL